MASFFYTLSKSIANSCFTANLPAVRQGQEGAKNIFFN